LGRDLTKALGVGLAKRPMGDFRLLISDFRFFSIESHREVSDRTFNLKSSI